MQRGSMRMRVGRSRDREGGAALVEFAVLAPLLILLVLGIIEFGYLFGQYNEIRHAVRETGRYAAVSSPEKDGLPNITFGDVEQVACDTLLLADSTWTVDVTVTDTTGDANYGLGDTGSVSITATISSLTNVPIISSFIPTSLTNSAEFRVEQDATWAPPATANSTDTASGSSANC